MVLVPNGRVLILALSGERARAASAQLPTRPMDAIEESVAEDAGGAPESLTRPPAITLSVGCSIRSGRRVPQRFEHRPAPQGTKTLTAFSEVARSFPEQRKQRISPPSQAQ